MANNEQPHPGHERGAGRSPAKVSPEVELVMRATPSEFAELHSLAYWGNSLPPAVSDYVKNRLRSEQLGRDPVEDRSLFAAHVQAESARTRELIGGYIGMLAERGDPQYAAVLWDRLVRDPNERVRNWTYSRFAEDTSLVDGWGTYDRWEPHPSALGIPWEVIASIAHRHIVAVQDEDFCNPTDPLPDLPLPDQRRPEEL